MIKVYQTIVDKGHGNCMQAAIASLLELSLEDVPNFIEYGDRWFSEIRSFLKNHDYKCDGMLHNRNYSKLCHPTDCCFKKEKFLESSIMKPSNLKKEVGVNGYFYAAVNSPKYFNLTDGFHNTHAVIIDKNFNVVHDVNPEYANILKYPLADLLRYNGIIHVNLISPISK